MTHNSSTTPDYVRESLNQLEAADNFRKILTVIYEDKPLDYAMVGALKAGIRYSLDAAQVYATLATVDRDRDRIRASLLEDFDRERRQLGLAPMASRP